MDALLRADAAHGEGEAAARVPGRKLLDRHAVRDRRQQPGTGRAAARLRGRHAVEVDVGPRMPDLVRIPVGRQVQGDEAAPLFGQIGRAVDAVQVDEVGRMAVGRGRDGGPVAAPGGEADTVVDRPVVARHRHQRSGHGRALGRHHDRPVARRHQGSVQRGDDLLGAADRVRPHGRERIGDRQDGERHGRPQSRSGRLATGGGRTSGAARPDGQPSATRVPAIGAADGPSRPTASR